MLILRQFAFLTTKNLHLKRRFIFHFNWQLFHGRLFPLWKLRFENTLRVRTSKFSLSAFDVSRACSNQFRSMYKGSGVDPNLVNIKGSLDCLFYSRTMEKSALNFSYLLQIKKHMH